MQLAIRAATKTFNLHIGPHVTSFLDSLNFLFSAYQA